MYDEFRFDSLPKLEKEIARLYKVLENGTKYPNNCIRTIRGLEANRIRFTHPRLFKLRIFLRNIFLKLADICW